MKRQFLILLLVIVAVNELSAQGTRYLVQFKDKGSSTFSLSNPHAYLSQRAIDRRTRYGITLDSTDLPVTATYISQLAAVQNVTIKNVSKWLNAVSIQTTDPNAITTIGALPFVQSVVGIAAKPGYTGSGNDIEKEQRQIFPSSPRGEGSNTYYNYGTNSFAEIHLLNGDFLHNIGLRGQGMQIAMLDNGFFNYTTLPAFDSVNINGQILGTWDFVGNEQNVMNDASHGMSCFSTISANIPGQFIGNAPKSDFWLFKTEDDASEYVIEEFNWACGAERADSSGTDIISTSLGYTTFDQPFGGTSHTYADMDGNTTVAAKAADLCAKKGILVFAANGNDGGNSWHFLGTPADADSVVAVGAVSATGIVAGFSSYGPSSDGQVKPDVAAVGSNAIIESSVGTIVQSNGTSFSCPKMAGLGTCLWQGFPEFNNMKIIDALHKAGSIAANPNDRIGNGIPNMKTAFGNLLTEYATSSASVNNCTVSLSWSSKDVESMKYEIERKVEGETEYSKVGELNPNAGAVLSINQYEFSDQLSLVPDGEVSYRIRQIIDADPDNLTAVFIDTASVAVSGCTAVAGVGDFIQVVPNPSASPTSLYVQTTNGIPSMTISIYDMKGSLVARLFKSKGPGQASFELPVERLLKGIYIIKVNDGQKEVGTTKLFRL